MPLLFNTTKDLRDKEVLEANLDWFQSYNQAWNQRFLIVLGFIVKMVNPPFISKPKYLIPK